MNIRTTFEHGFAAVICGSTVLLVFGGTIAACLGIGGIGGIGGIMA